MADVKDGGARVPSLDGLRAVSIAGVLIAHAFFQYRQTHDTLWLRRVTNLGPLGVSVFFAISGFIITSLLVREQETQGRISLKAFYIRRAFRILPPFWVYLLFAIVVGPDTSWEQIRNAFLFLTDYLPSNWWMGHSWSLSVEEQFYLFWPLALILARKRARRVAVWLILLSPLIRIATHLAVPTRALDSMFHTRMDSLMIGCLIALTRGEWHTCLPLRVLGDGRTALLGVAHLVVISPMLLESFHGLYHYPLGGTLEALAIGSIILWAIQNPESAIGRVLNSSPARHVGYISYSLYLWQQPFFSRELYGHWLGQFPFNMLAAVLVAELSYRFVERPALGLRERLTQARSEVRAVTGSS